MSPTCVYLYWRTRETWSISLFGVMYNSTTTSERLFDDERSNCFWLGRPSSINSVYSCCQTWRSYGSAETSIQTMLTPMCLDFSWLNSEHPHKLYIYIYIYNPKFPGFESRWRQANFFLFMYSKYIYIFWINEERKILKNSKYIYIFWINEGRQICLPPPGFEPGTSGYI